MTVSPMTGDVEQNNPNTMYVLITWPEIQEYMEYEGFREHSCLADDEYFFNSYGSSAYFVDVEWLMEMYEKKI